MLIELSKNQNFYYFAPASVICTKDDCATELSNFPIYYDNSHLNLTGMKNVAKLLFKNFIFK